MHHSLVDGLGVMMMFFNFDDNPQIKNLPNISLREPFWKLLLIYILVPILVVKAGLTSLIYTPIEINGIKNDKIGEEMTALKQMAFSKDISLDRLKERSKELGVTLNELFFALIS